MAGKAAWIYGLWVRVRIKPELHTAAYREMIERPFANKEPAAVVTDKRESEAGREGSGQGRGWL